MKLWSTPSPPPLLRRLTTRKSYSDLASAKRSKSKSSRGDSDHTFAKLGRQPKSDKHAADFDIILIDAPSTPSDESSSPSPSSAHHEPMNITLLEKPRPKVKDKPFQKEVEISAHDAVSPQEQVERKPHSAPEAGKQPQVRETELIYPWYRRRLCSPAGTNATAQPSLFPRSDFALSGSSRGSLNLFGGLVNDHAKNDVYTISLKDQSVTRMHTIGDIPPPRFGQAGACAGSVAVVWGGDTTSASSNQLQARAKYDNGLYFLNLVSREWTRITVSGPAPKGRIGHSVVMIGPKIYIFGGEADGKLFNDLWCFDLSTLVLKPAWEQIELPRGAGEKPAPRSGHVCVAYKDQLIIFGGTDTKYHYNDTWAFDTTTKAWCEMPCSGYIPAPREGHAAAIVDDIVYIFGGRGVHGADIGQLAAFKISSKRWFTFQNMGPEPTPRSGHGMVVVGSKVYVLGGVCEENAREANEIYILETNNIRYPSSRLSPPQRGKLVP